MSDLEPITRAENFWVNEGDLEPITRKEQYIKHLYDETQVVPEYPKTREEYFINKAGEELHDVTIEQLTATENRTYSEEGVAYSPVIVNVPQTTLTTLDVTENGTYTAPSGTAYNEVDVDVPLPENAYLLKDIPNTPSPIATFTDGSPLPMPKLEVAVEPQQEGSGDPSPTNIRPIIGWSAVDVTKTGKNLLPMNRGYNFQYNPDVGATMDVTTATVGWTDDGNGDFSCTIANWVRNGLLAPIPKNQIITMSMYIKEGAPRLTTVFLDKDFKVVGKWGNLNPSSSGEYYRLVFTPSAEVCYIGICIIGSDGNKITINNPTIQIGNVAIDYEPYNGSTITIQLGDTYYGGKLDVVSGVLTVDRGYVDLGDLNWTLENEIFRLNESIGAKLTTNTSAVANMLCSIYKTVSQNAMGSTSTDHCIAGLNWSNGVRVKDSDYTDTTSFKTAMNGVQLVYELATPITYQLTPTAVKSLLGTNNLWADTGDVVDGQYFSKEE